MVSVVGGGSSQALAFNFHLGFPTWNLFAPPMAGRCCHQEVGCQGCVVCGGASLRAADAAARTLNPDQAWACPLRALRSMGAPGFRWNCGRLFATLDSWTSPPHRKDARFGRLAFLCRPWSHSFRPPVNHSTLRHASFLKTGPSAVLSLGDTRALTVASSTSPLLTVGRKGPPCRHSFDPLLPRRSLDLSSISFSRLSPARRKTRKGPLEGCASIRHHTPRTLSRLPSVINPLCREGAVLSIWSTYVAFLPPTPVCWLRHRHRASNLSVSPT